MSLLEGFRNLLAEPRLQGVDLDGEDRLAVHRDVLASKPMIRDVFLEIYALCRSLDSEHLRGEGDRVELGSGSSLFKTFHPDVIATDVLPAAWIDRTLDAHAMSLADGSVRAFYGIHCFHHFHDPAAFFGELERVLNPGGGCVLVEPYYGPLARAFYRRAFATEHFDTSQSTWQLPPSGAMVGANQALSWIVFERDREAFERDFPELEIVAHHRLPNALRYVASGGLNFRQLLPTFTAPLLTLLERIAAPAGHLFALHHVVVIRRRGAVESTADG